MSLDGRTVLGSRLGFRITELFVDRFLGRIFETPDAVFPDSMLRPEKQDLAQFASGVDAIVETQTRVALQYFEDGSVQAACPPLKALLHIMAYGSYEGKGSRPRSPRFFRVGRRCLQATGTRSGCGSSRIATSRCGSRHLSALESAGAAVDGARAQLGRVSAPDYLQEIEGTIGADPFHFQF